MFYLEFTPQVPSSIILFSLDTLSPSYCFVPPFFKLLLMRTWPFFDISTQHLPSSICYFFHRIPFHLPAASSLYFSSCYSCAQGRFLIFQNNSIIHCYFFTGYPFAFLSLLSSIFQVVTHAYRAVFWPFKATPIYTNTALTQRSPVDSHIPTCIYTICTIFN